jgi:hypothetical protein
MSLKQLENLIHRYPHERDSIIRLFDIIEAEEKLISKPHIFTINRIFEKTRPTSTLQFAEILSFLEQQGILQKILRVESPTTKAGIKDFSTYLDIPHVIHDPYSDTDINIKSDNVVLLYSVVK